MVVAGPGSLFGWERREMIPVTLIGYDVAILLAYLQEEQHRRGSRIATAFGRMFLVNPDHEITLLIGYVEHKALSAVGG